jgi:hypothetical protein
VNPNLIPKSHRDQWVDLLNGYVAEMVRVLVGNGIQVRRSWLDPSDPRDATIVYAPRQEYEQVREIGDFAMIWDEETGWRYGRFVHGRPGARTVLARHAHLGGSLLPDPSEVAWNLVNRRESECRKYRSFNDYRDGLDDVLRACALRTF